MTTPRRFTPDELLAIAEDHAREAESCRREPACPELAAIEERLAAMLTQAAEDAETLDALLACFEFGISTFDKMTARLKTRGD